jgi:phage terminase large subunit-like protein
MRRERLQAETVDLIWIDERPEEQIYSELLARTSAVDGHLIVSYTPIGDGAAAGVTYRFLVEPSSDRAPFRITSTEAKHITEEEALARFGRPMIDAETEPAEIPIKKADHVVPPTGSTSLVAQAPPFRYEAPGRWAVTPPFGAACFIFPVEAAEARNLEHFPAALNQGDSQLLLPRRIWRN